VKDGHERASKDTKDTSRARAQSNVPEHFYIAKPAHIKIAEIQQKSKLAAIY